MAISPAGIAGVFDQAADTYDHVGVPWFGPVAQGLVAELAVRPGERVLDVGCGRGAALRPLAEERDDVVRRATALLDGWETHAFSQDVRYTLGRRP